MRNLFKSKQRITQIFANKLIVNGKEYYKQFGLLGHEGLDLVPTGSVWDVLCLEDGVVVKDIDDAVLGKGYGKNVTVWHPTIAKATQYCHLASNDVSLGQRVTRGQKIGVMGKTGNTMGTHLHLNLFLVDANGIRLNRNNGFWGGIDPEPFLAEEVVSEPSTTVPIEKTTFENLVRKATITDKIKEKLKVNDSETVILGELDKLISYEDVIVDKDKKIQQATTKISDLEQEVKKLSEENDHLIDANEVLKNEVEEQANTIKKEGFEINTLREKIEEIKVNAKLPIFTGFKKILVDFIARF